MVHKKAQYEALIINNTEHPLNIGYSYGLREKNFNLLFQNQDSDGHYRHLLKSVFWGEHIIQNQIEDLKVMQLRESEHVLSFEMAESLQLLDFTKSIDPVFFLELQEYN
jgi:hypothetical protein